MKKQLFTIIATAGLIAAACGSDTADEASADVDCDTPPVVTDGQLTVATGETVFPPWMGAGADEIRAITKRSGMRTLREDGWLKVGQGLTSVEEVLCATG